MKEKLLHLCESCSAPLRNPDCEFEQLSIPAYGPCEKCGVPAVNVYRASARKVLGLVGGE